MDPDKVGDAGEDNHEVSPGDGAAPLNTNKYSFKQYWFIFKHVFCHYKQFEGLNNKFVLYFKTFVQIFLRNFRIVTVLEEFHFVTCNLKLMFEKKCF